MDLRAYYQKIRKIEETIHDEHPVVISEETGDGGAAGCLTEVARPLAAKLIAEGKARLASEDEALTYRNGLREAHRAAAEEYTKSRVQLAVVPETELSALRNAAKPKK